MNLPCALEPPAIRCYQLHCELSLLFDVIPITTYHERMAYLNDLLGDPDSPPEGSGAPFTPPDSGSPDDSPGQELRDASGMPSPHNREEDGLLKLIPSGPLSCWTFHEGDPDPLPSVPHGHYYGRRFPKLDPYFGWVHSSSTSIKERLTKRETASLWNDEKFRSFSRAALLHFIQENPRFSWRVAYPLSLPRPTKRRKRPQT